ncbi:MAG: hypothetical protein COV01_01995 [Candidatus Taylorbacteria bacterium CG10_big_fil_rev_8_21_14_0_10_41_48]|uniref:Uncharacterized protein n=1 Tax=Candidatus Taylorbacteria bacterium CG10_big_fil_rev_8_21_14_0_10_41_48 TaxID=1975024 RepID=A0A2M8LC93_9BACT|nr:MAG: hypothetical protein COV01_01995 [Candidatus Taylorbacteria bacterium CG10_big_fil_rev_8_21_14_0_10_41_48]
MIIRFKSLPLGGRFFVHLDSIEYIGIKVAPFSVLSKDRNKFYRVNAVLIPKLKLIYGSNGLIATIPRRGRILIAA